MLHLVRFSMLVGSLMLLLSGCGPARLGQEATPTFTPASVSVPTFTPTPLPPQTTAPPTAQPTVTVPSALPEPIEMPTVTVAQATATTEPMTEAITAAEPLSATAPGDATAISLLPTPTNLPAIELAPTATEVAAAQGTVIIEAANVRSGPSTEYPLVGAVAAGEQYPLTGRSAQGDWWQICCFAEQPGWIYGPLVEVQNADLVAEVTDLPPLPEQPTPIPVAEAAPAPAPQEASEAVEVEADASDAAPAEEAPAAPVSEAPAAPEPGTHSGTAGNFDPNAQYQIAHYRVLGFDDNNGGIFNKGGQQLIFVTVLDQNGSPIDGAVVKDAVGDKLNVVTGDKGPGKAEIKMDWDPYKLYVAADPSGEVTSQISNQMNNPYPHIPDVVGLLGPPENEYAICPTIDDRCEPPFYHAHWSYEITFQRVK